MYHTQGGATGRLLMYDPRTRITELLADGIWFANGVALSGAHRCRRRRRRRCCCCCCSCCCWLGC